MIDHRSQRIAIPQQSPFYQTVVGSGLLPVLPAVLEAKAIRDAILNPPTVTASSQEITAGPSRWKLIGALAAGVVGIGAVYLAMRRKRR